jgi:hypothetical protein
MDEKKLDKNKTNIIQIDDVKAEGKLQVQIPSNVLGEGTGSFQIKTKAVSLDIPTTIIDSSLLRIGGSLQISQNQLSATEAKALLDKAPNGAKNYGKVFAFNMNVYDSNNKAVSEIHNFAKGKSVKVTINLGSEDLKGMDTSKLSAFYYDETAKKWVDIGGSFDTVKMTYSFDTTHFTHFTIMQKAEGTTSKSSVGNLAGICIAIFAVIAVAVFALLYIKKVKKVN